MAARDEIVRTIPNRIKPINFCLPIYKDDAYAPWQLDAAFSLLRIMSPTGVPLDYRRFKPKKLDHVPISPWLRDPEKLRGVAVFREYVFDWPERIALDALFDAQRMGAQVYNYTQVTGLKRIKSERHWQLSLDQPNQRASVLVTADIVLNLAGAWVDGIIQKADAKIEPKCAMIKGVHIAVRLPDAFSDWGVFTFNSIGEPLYCLPLNGFHYVGLTRTPFEGDASDVSATDQEIDWLIAETNRCLPRLEISRSDILFTWAGVNPLTRDPKDSLGSREIKIHDLTDEGMPGVFALTGGAIMTHRLVAKKLVRMISDRLLPSDTPQAASFQPIVSDQEQFTNRTENETAHISAAEIERCARDEKPGNLGDLLMRRLGMGWTADQGLASAHTVAKMAAPYLGWSEKRVNEEVRIYEKHLNTARRRPGS